MLKGEIWESLGIEPTTFSAEGGQLNHCATAPDTGLSADDADGKMDPGYPGLRISAGYAEHL